MANTGAPTDLELKALRFFHDIELGKDPCQPVGWQFITRVTAALVRRGLATDDHRCTPAGVALAKTLPPTPRGCVGHRCSRDRRL